MICKASQTQNRQIRDSNLCKYGIYNSFPLAYNITVHLVAEALLRQVLPVNNIRANALTR